MESDWIHNTMWSCGRCGERNEEATSACSVCAGVRPGNEASSCETCGVPVSAGLRRCAACERAMTDVPSGRLTRIWSCVNPTEAELLRVELRRAGIESVLENEGGVAYAIGMGTSVVPLVITVAEENARRSLEIIRAERNRPPSEVYIPPVAMLKFPCGCGKELEVPPDFKGLDMDCPYCGRAVRAS